MVFNSYDNNICACFPCLTELGIWIYFWIRVFLDTWGTEGDIDMGGLSFLPTLLYMTASVAVLSPDGRMPVDQTTTTVTTMGSRYIGKTELSAPKI